MILKKKPTKQDIIVIFSIIFFVVSIVYLLDHYGLEMVIRGVRNQGTAGKILYVLYLISASVFPPLTSIILKPIALLAYGFEEALLLGFIGMTLGGFFSFLIAKNMGRAFMTKLLGKDMVGQIDQFSRVQSIKSFIKLRLAGLIYHDYISYAAGLAGISLTTYIIVSLPVNLLWEAIILYVSSRAFSFGISYLLSFIGFFYIAGIIASIAIWKRKKSQA